MDAVLFGDVEESVITWLNQQLDESVYDRVPSVTSTMLPLVIVERLGGPAVSVVTEQATVTVEAWAKSWRTAQNLAQRARQAVHNLAGQTVAGLTFYRVREFNGPGRLPDPVSGFPRFVFTVSLTVRYASAPVPPPPPALTTLTGTGSVTVSGLVARYGAGALSGSGTVTVSGTVSGHVTVNGAAALSGTGTVASGGNRTLHGASASSGTGTVTVSGVRTRYGATDLTGTGTLTASGSSSSSTPEIDVMVPFAFDGSLHTLTGTARFPITRTGTLNRARAMVGTAPTGASIIVDINKNGTTMFSSKPTIAIGATDTTGGNVTPSVTTLAAGDYITVDVDQVGTTIPGADLVVTLDVTWA